MNIVIRATCIISLDVHGETVEALDRTHLPQVSAAEVRGTCAGSSDDG